MRRLIARPATAIFSSAGEEDTVVICMAAYVSNHHEVDTTLELEGTEDIRLVDIANVKTEDWTEVNATTIASDLSVLVRATIDEDAVAVPGLLACPLPVSVITATIAGENMDTHVEALVEDDGYVSTLLLVTDVGLFTRYSRTWIGLRDVGLIDGVNTVDVHEHAVEVYDAADDLGQQVSIEGLPTETRDAVGAGQLFISASATRTFSTDEPVAASAMATLPVIDTLDQLTAAVETADADETLRWYVEKRALALGADVQMPWKS